MQASENGHAQVAKLLLDKGANVNVRDIGGETALICASRHGHVEIVRMLLDKGADVNVKALFGYTPLSVAGALSMNLAAVKEIVDLLKAHGAKE